MESITDFDFVCIDNINCPANYNNSKTIFSYQDTYAIPDKKNETCCPKCNSLLIRQEVYDEILELNKRRKQRKVIIAAISTLSIIFLIFYYFIKINN
jgi:hypothetical protein